MSALASNNNRMGKPFNPLLGETYQLEQDDFRIFCEQVCPSIIRGVVEKGYFRVKFLVKVCHHPPVSAFHAEGGENGSDFIFHGSMYPKVNS